VQPDDLGPGGVLVPTHRLEGCSGLAFAVSSLEDGVFALLTEWMHLN
jgi:hypothetical protein